jgi:hydrogenase nickel incorporation protein HypA/HybF
VHELSIAVEVVSLALDALREAGEPGVAVEEVRLRVGVLSGVEPVALRFCYPLAAEGTPLAGSRLAIEEVPVALFCTACGVEAELAGVQDFTCPRCGRPSNDLRRGRELELVSIRVADPVDVTVE